MYVDRGFDPDPLAPKKHRILLEQEPDQWFIVATSEEPIEMLRLMVARDHAIGMQQKNMMIFDEKEQKGVERFENYIPKPQDRNAPISPENQKVRDRWIGNIMKWLLDRELWDAPDTPETQAKIKASLEEQHVEISVNPNGTEVLFLRDGGTLAAWSV